MGKPTSGEWSISGVLEGRGDISISAGRLVVATAHNGVSFFDVLKGNEPEQQWANARLIAAAPELLEALRECRRVMLVEDSLRPGYGWADHVATHVDPAIAKATGETP